MIEAEIVIGESENELAFRQPESFGDIREDVARFGDDDIAIIAPEMSEKLALFRVARIVANDDFDVRRRPGTGLRNSGTGQQTFPVGREQNRKLHEPAAGLWARPKPRRRWIHTGAKQGEPARSRFISLIRLMTERYNLALAIRFVPRRMLG